MPDKIKKSTIERQNEAQAGFDSLLTDLAKSKVADYEFRVESDADEILIAICNSQLTLRSDGTYSVE